VDSWYAANVAARTGDGRGGCDAGIGRGADGSLGGLALIVCIPVDVND
jgi:hypothetical protein